MESTRIRGVHDLSYPVLDPRACAVAAMTMPFLERLDVEDVSLGAARDALADAAARLSEALGSRPRPAATPRTPAAAPGRTPPGPSAAATHGRDTATTPGSERSRTGR